MTDFNFNFILGRVKGLVTAFDRETKKIESLMSIVAGRGYYMDSMQIQLLADHSAQAVVIENLRDILDNDDNEAIEEDLDEYKETLTRELLRFRPMRSTSTIAVEVNNLDMEFKSKVLAAIRGTY